MKYSFTGISNGYNIEHQRIVHSIIKDLKDGTEFNSGAAHGVDTECAIAVSQKFPDAVNRIIVPDAYHNEKVLKYATDLIHMPMGTDNDSSAFRARNKALVELCDCLIAFPKTEKELFRGSGTWMTIRMARKAEKEIRIYPLEEE